jgi:hypothetical protein
MAIAGRMRPNRMMGRKIMRVFYQNGGRVANDQMAADDAKLWYNEAPAPKGILKR